MQRLRYKAAKSKRTTTIVAAVLSFVGSIAIYAGGKHMLMKSVEVATEHYYHRKLRKTLVNPGTVRSMTTGVPLCFAPGHKGTYGFGVSCVADILVDTGIIQEDSGHLLKWATEGSVTKAFNPSNVMPPGKSNKIATDVMNLLPKGGRSVPQNEFRDSVLAYYDENRNQFWGWASAEDKDVSVFDRALTSEESETANDFRWVLDEFLMVADLGGGRSPRGGIRG